MAQVITIVAIIGIENHHRSVNSLIPLILGRHTAAIIEMAEAMERIETIFGDPDIKAWENLVEAFKDPREIINEKDIYRELQDLDHDKRSYSRDHRKPLKVKDQYKKPVVIKCRNRLRG